jgi:hypothetical protein
MNNKSLEATNVASTLSQIAEARQSIVRSAGLRRRDKAENGDVGHKQRRSTGRNTTCQAAGANRRTSAI